MHLFTSLTAGCDPRSQYYTWKSTLCGKAESWTGLLTRCGPGQAESNSRLSNTIIFRPLQYRSVD